MVRRGAEEAGAIFVTVERPDRTIDLYAPAPQTAFDDATPGRLFQRIVSAGTAESVNARIAKEARFDSDLWVVAIEDRDGRCFLDLAPA